MKSDLNRDGYWAVHCNSDIDYDGSSFAMLMEEQAGVKMTQEYFELEASKSTPMYGYQKGLKIFGDSGYQAMVKELRDNLRYAERILHQGFTRTSISYSSKDLDGFGW